MSTEFDSRYNNFPQNQGIQRLFNYTAYRDYMERVLSIYGQPCRIYNIPNKEYLGYEDGDTRTLAGMYSLPKKIKFQTEDLKCWIDFNPSKSVFYHFNWFPENTDNLLVCYLSNPTELTEFNYIRTSIVQQTSIWGDNIFSIEQIKDDGLYKTLKRTYFLRLVSSQELKSYIDGQVSDLTPKVSV